MEIKSKEEILLDTLSKIFYNNPEFEIVINIITGKSDISLRIIDYFTTNYSYKYNIIYPLNKNESYINFNVYNSYKNQLKAFNKRCFDPFCRINKKNNLKRIIFKYNENQFIETTIGQINFFKWAIENKILTYIKENYNTIYNMMNNNIKVKNDIIIKTKNELICNKKINFYLTF